MVRQLLTLVFCMILGPPGALWASDLRQPQSTLYSYQNSIELQDDFVGGITTSGSIGLLAWSSAGTITLPSSTTNRIGLARLDTGAVSGTQSRLSFGQNSVVLNPANDTQLFWINQLNTNDANTTIRVGASNPVANDPPTEGIYLEKLAADTNWFCVTRAGGVQTRTDTTVAVTTTFTKLGYTRNSSGVQFAINDVNRCGLHTTNIPTVFIGPVTFIINTAAAAKTVDVDYFQLRITNLIR